MRMVDVLPAPFGPRKPNASPGSTAKSMPSTATKLPKRLVTLVPSDQGLGARDRHERRRYRWRRDLCRAITTPGAVDARRMSGTDVGDLATVGPLAQPHDLVDRVEVRARRRLDHVGGDAAAR